MGGSCIYLREWFIFMINVGKYHTFSVWAWVDILNSRTVVGWFGVKYLDLWFASMLHLPRCINPPESEVFWRDHEPLFVYQGLLFGLLLKPLHFQ